VRRLTGDAKWKGTGELQDQQAFGLRACRGTTARYEQRRRLPDAWYLSSTLRGRHRINGSNDC
jgi:hypothetical protein